MKNFCGQMLPNKRRTSHCNNKQRDVLYCLNTYFLNSHFLIKINAAQYCGFE